MLFTHGGVLDIVWRHASARCSRPRDASMLNVSINRVGVSGRALRGCAARAPSLS